MEIKWEGVVEAFSKSFSKRNLKRINQPGYEFEDLFHDCYIVFAQCRNTFKGDNIAQFIKMYKVSLNNMVKDMIRKEIQDREVEETLEGD